MSYIPSGSAIYLATVRTKSHDFLIGILQELQNVQMDIIKAMLGNPKNNTSELRLSKTVLDVQVVSVSTSNRHELKVFTLECARIENSLSDIKKRQKCNNQDTNLINLICYHHVF